MRSFTKRLAVAVLVTAVIGIGGIPRLASADVVEDPLHGYCSPAATQCIDNGANSPTTQNPPQNFGFTVSPGPATGVTLLIDFLIPNPGPSQAPPGTIPLTGTLSGSATLFSATPWTSGGLDAYLGLAGGASPANPIGAYLPAAQVFDPGATGFLVFQASFSPAGGVTLQGPANPNVSPLENTTTQLPLGAYVVGFLNQGSAATPNWTATANSGAIFETGPPRVPEPTTLLLLGAGLVGLCASAWKRRG